MNDADLNEDIHQYPIVSKPSFVSEYSVQRTSQFDNIYCVNLTRRSDRWKSVEKRFNEKNIKVERFEAIDGDTLKDENGLSKNEIGCICSHLEVIKDAKKSGYEKILIFEDDVYFSNDFEQKIKLIDDFSWKLLYLGGSQYKWENLDISKNFYYSCDTLGTFAYAVDSSIYDDIISEFSKKDAPADRILTRIQKKYYGQCFTLYPNIVIPDVSESDIRPTRIIEEHAIKMKWNLDNFSMKSGKKKNILLLPDARGWAFDNIAQAIKKYNPYPNEIHYDILYARDLYKEDTIIDPKEWDLIYVMFEAERIVPRAKNVIRGCYAAYWLENPNYTPEVIAKLFKKCKGAVFANSGLRDRLKQFLPKNFPVEVINDAADENVFYPIDGKKNEDFTVLFVGKTGRAIKNFSSIASICKKAGVNLEVREHTEHSKLVYEYAKADICINFSTFEGGPQTFVEAALCGVPMLIRNTNELSKIIPCFTGEDENEFVEILKYLKENRHECVLKGKEAYEVAINGLTYRHAAKKFAEFFVSNFPKRNLKDELTVFVIKFGNNPNYADCIQALKKQTCEFNIEEISNIAPMSAAFQQMIQRCETPYYVQVDEDMILEPDAIEKLYDSIRVSKHKVCMVSYMLKDVHLNFDIYGVKIYKYDIMLNYPYNLEIISCEKEQMSRLEENGFSVEMIERVIGKHSPKWTNELIYERYFDLMEKWKVHKYHWMGKLPHKLLQIYKQNPSDLNFYALAGSMYSMSSPDPIRKREKNFTIQEDNFKMIKSMYLL